MGESAPSPVSQAIQEHAALVATAVLAAFAVFRLVRVADGELTTASAILHYAGTANVVIASVMVLVPYAVVWGAIAAIARALNERDFWTYSTLIGVLAVTALAITPVGVLVAAVASGLVLIPPLIARRRDRATVQRTLTLVFGILFTPLIVSRHIWLPTETIKTQGSVHVGYVLDDGDSASLVLLDHDDRQVTRIASDAVETRRFCEVRSTGPNWLERAFDVSLPALVRQTAGYPQCPRPSSSPKAK